MQNPATIHWEGLNDFTTHVKDNPGCLVRLRNGDIVQPEFHPAQSEHECDMFGVNGVSYHTWYRWDPNGVALKNSDLDMMEIL